MAAGKTNSFKELRLRLGLSAEEVAEITGYNLRTVYRWENGETSPRTAVTELLRKKLQDLIVSAGKSAHFTFIDLFAGIGGMRMGFEAAGGRCVFTGEWDSSCLLTYRANFPGDEPVAGDITMVPEEEIPSHDVLLAGFPCQPFSLAGVSKKNSLGRKHGFLCESQGTLFFDVARIIAFHRPEAFLLENVKNLVSHDKGNTFRVIRETLGDELGYHISWRVIDAKGFVPQHRERIFIAGFREDTGFDLADLELPDPVSGPRLSSVLHREDGSERPEEPYTSGPMAEVNGKYTLSKALWDYLKAYAVKHRMKGNGFGYGLVTPNDVARTLSARYYKDGSEILVSRGRKNPRRLTPRECARLMGFDMPGRAPFRIPVSDTRAYRQFGNAVVVPVVEAIAGEMKPYVLGEKRTPRTVQLPLGIGERLAPPDPSLRGRSSASHSHNF